MLFSSTLFLWIFLPSVLAIDYLFSRCFGNKGSNIILLVASLLFYAWGEPTYVFLMLGSILVNWVFGCLIGRSMSRTHRKIYLLFAVSIDIGVLCCFKYLGMLTAFVNTLVGMKIMSPQELPLPIGISFYTFQAMSYVIDVYRSDCIYQKNPLYLGLYISFFPQLIAGPILRYKDIEEQLLNRRREMSSFVEGVRRFTYGLGKKILIANVLASAVDKIYGVEAAQLTGLMAWMASILYTFQIYYDFSGYSDMAIGLGKMFGFNFSENFMYPYTSLSIREFWKRWHVSLGTWFREYVYIPLGGNRHGKRLTYENLFIVFFLTGLWHGASVSFILWGLFHGCFSVAERLWFGVRLKKKGIIAWMYTFLVVNFGWVLFRLENINDAFRVIKRMVFPWNYTQGEFILAEAVNNHVAVTAVAAFLGMGLLQRLLKGTAIEKRWKNSIPEYMLLFIMLWLCFFSLAADSYNPFIYFRF